MGFMEAAESSIEGLLGGIIIGGVYAGAWATLITYYGNTEVFLLGGLVLTIFGIVPVAYAVGLIKKIMQDTTQEREKINEFTERFRGSE